MAPCQEDDQYDPEPAKQEGQGVEACEMDGVEPGVTQHQDGDDQGQIRKSRTATVCSASGSGSV